jgi:hypothetical protein
MTESSFPKVQIVDSNGSILDGFREDESGGGSGASAANQTAVQATAGSNATKAIAIQGIDGGKVIPVSGTFWQGTQPVSLTAGSNIIGSIGNTTFASTQSGTCNLNSISGSITLPTGAATSSKQDSLINLFPNSLGAKSSAGSLSVTPASDAFIPVVGSLFPVSVSFSRPADVIGYAALDVISSSTLANLTFTNLARTNGGSAYIVKARLMTNQSTNTARFRLHLFHTAPTAIADNAPYPLLFSNAANRVGHIDFPSCTTEGTGSDAARSKVDDGRLSFVCASGSRDLIGILETLDAFTPSSGQQFFIELTADLN